MNPTDAPTAAAVLPATPVPASVRAPGPAPAPGFLRSRWAALSRRLGAALLAPVLLGTVAALAARTLIGLLTRLAGDEARLSAAETVVAILVFAVPLVPGAIAAAWQMRRAGTVLLTAGAGFLLLESLVIVLQEDRAAVVAQGGGAVALAVLVVVALWLLVVVEAVAVGRLSRAWGGPRSDDAP